MRSLLNVHSPGNVFQICASGINTRVNIIILDASNTPNRHAPTVSVVKKYFSVLIALLVMF